MGAVSSLISPQAVFFVTAALAVPTLLVLTLICEEEIDRSAPMAASTARSAAIAKQCRDAAGKPSLLILTFCVFLFHAANAAMLPLVGAEMTVRSGYWATALVAACIVLPQLVVALIAPGIGRLAVSKGRRPVLVLGFAVLPIRAAVLALNTTRPS
jgi:hypothetical protein